MKELICLVLMKVLDSLRKIKKRIFSRYHQPSTLHVTEKPTCSEVIQKSLNVNDYYTPREKEQK